MAPWNQGHWIVIIINERLQTAPSARPTHIGWDGNGAKAGVQALGRGGEGAPGGAAQPRPLGLRASFQGVCLSRACVCATGLGRTPHPAVATRRDKACLFRSYGPVPRPRPWHGADPQLQEEGGPGRQEALVPRADGGRSEEGALPAGSCWAAAPGRNSAQSRVPFRPLVGASPDKRGGAGTRRAPHRRRRLDSLVRKPGRETAAPGAHAGCTLPSAHTAVASPCPGHSALPHTPSDWGPFLMLVSSRTPSTTPITAQAPRKSL